MAPRPRTGPSRRTFLPGQLLSNMLPRRCMEGGALSSSGVTGSGGANPEVELVSAKTSTKMSLVAEQRSGLSRDPPYRAGSGISIPSGSLDKVFGGKRIDTLRSIG